MNTVDVLKAASIKPLYEIILLSDYDSALGGEIRVRVNLTPKMREEWFAIGAESDELEARGDVVTQAEKDAHIDRALSLMASLIPLDESGKSLTLEQIKEILAPDANGNDALQGWFTDQVWEKVAGYTDTHFLALLRKRLANKSARGKTQSTATATP